MSVARCLAPVRARIIEGATACQNYRMSMIMSTAPVQVVVSVSAVGVCSAVSIPRMCGIVRPGASAEADGADAKLTGIDDPVAFARSLPAHARNEQPLPEVTPQ